MNDLLTVTITLKLISYQLITTFYHTITSVVEPHEVTQHSAVVCTHERAGHAPSRYPE